MANTTIIYTAARRLRSGVTAGDEITLEIDLESFDRSIRSNRRTSRAIDGTQSDVLHALNDIYDCATLAIAPANRSKVDEFLYSVSGGETFTMTNLDESDRVMTCKLQGDFSRSRETTAQVDFFNYTFSVQEV